MRSPLRAELLMQGYADGSLAGRLLDILCSRFLFEMRLYAFFSILFVKHIRSRPQDHKAKTR